MRGGRGGGEARWPRGPGELLPCIGYIGTCSPKGYGFSTFLVINRVSILAILVIEYGFCTLILNWVYFFRRSYFFIIVDKTINKNSLHKLCLAGATVPTAMVKNRISNFWSDYRQGRRFCFGAGHTPPPIFGGVPYHPGRAVRVGGLWPGSMLGDIQSSYFGFFFDGEKPEAPKETSYFRV